LAGGGVAAPTSTLGSLYTGIGANNVAASDSISLTYSIGGVAQPPVTATASDISAALGTTTPATGMQGITTQQMADWMKSKFGGTYEVALNSSGEFVATNTAGTAVDFTLAMGPLAKGTIPLGGSSSRTSWSNVMSKGQNAFYTMNGMSITSSSNADSNTFTGATVSLKTVSENASTQTQLTLNRDTAGIQKKVQDFLDSYNDIIKFIDDKSTNTVTTAKDSKGMSQNKVTPGDLTADTSVRGIKSQLRTMITSPVPGLSAKTKYDSLASVGILTDKDTGGLAIDEKKFQAALAADFDGVRRLFANSGWTDNSNATVGGWTDSTKAGTYAMSPSTDVVDGKPGNRIGDILFSQSGDSTGLGVTAPTSITGTVNATFVRGVSGQIQQYINTLTTFDGAYNTNKKTVQQQIDEFSKQSDRVQTRVDAYRKNLVSQFSAMENAMLKIKNQSSAFMAQIGG
jgi:flagellar capping protein FliD